MSRRQHTTRIRYVVQTNVVYDAAEALRTATLGALLPLVK